MHLIDNLNITSTWYSLNDLYYSTSGDHWYNNTNWLSNEPFGDWYGITTNSYDDIIAINLGENNLIGYIPSTLSYLTDLQVIDLAKNHLTGQVSLNYANLLSLEYFDVSNNKFTGPRIDEFCPLKSIFHLNLAYNLYQGYLPACISNWSNIYNLMIGNNYLTGFVDPVSTLANITKIDLSNNLLSGSFPRDFDKFVNLTEIDFCVNTITGQLDFYCNLLFLTRIEVSYNFLTGTVPFCNSDPIITDYHIEQNYLSGSIPSYLQSSTINHLDLSNNYLSGPFSNVYNPDFKFIYIYQNYFSGSIPSFIFSNITFYDQDFRISDNYFSGSLNSNYLSCFEIRMNDNYISGPVPYSSLISPNFRILYIYNNLLSGSLPIEFWNFIYEMNSNPEYYIRLDNNQLTGTLQFEFTLINWHSFIINNNFFSGSILYTIGDLICQNFQIENNFFTGNSININTNNRFDSFNIGNNYFTGEILISLSYHIRSFLYLIIRHNLFTGEIKEIFDIGFTNTDLIQLDLKSNIFSGTIPSNIYYFSNISSLSIGNNLLEGTIPTTLSSITGLKLLDITGLNMCYYKDIARAVLEASSGDLIRCQDMQDVAMCTILFQSKIYSSIAQSNNEVAITFDSTHFYEPNQDTMELVSIDNALYYLISFDEWSELESCFLCDYIRFCIDRACTRIYGDLYTGTNFPGMNRNEPLRITGTSFYINFVSDSFVEYWGYSLTVTAIIPRVGWNCTTPPNNSLPLSMDILKMYNLSYDQSYAMNFCGDYDQWEGVTCTQGFVTKLSFGSYGIPGTIPSTISLLTNLEELDFSYNSFSGGIPYNFGDLVNLRYLDFSNNRLTKNIPESLGSMTSIEDLFLYSNFLTGSLPDSLYLSNVTLQSLLLSANQLTGKLDNNLCSLSNASIDISGNSMDCYESCWEKSAESDLLKTDLSLCAPTNYPTSVPTSPTASPTKYNNQTIFDINANTILSIVLIITFIIISVCFSLYTLWGRENRIKIKQRLNKLNQLPIHKLLYLRASDDEIDGTMYANINLKTLYELDYDGLNAFQLAVKLDSSNRVLYNLLKYFLPIDITGSDINSNMHKYAWTFIIQNDKYNQIVEQLFNNLPFLIEKLVNTYDEKGRPAINIASPANQRVFKNYIYFMGKYDLQGQTIPHHKSSTSLVYIGIDHDMGCRVAIKLLSSYEHYIREKLWRNKYQLDPSSVVEIIDSYDVSSSSRYQNEINRRGWSNYPFCIVMPAADRILDSILSNENISGKEWYIIKPLSWQIASALGHLHTRGIVHGDIKPSNIVRFGDKLKLIDLDSSTCIGKQFETIKLSTGFIPPEFLQRDFNNKISIISNIIYTNESIDAWSYGLVLYKLCTGFSLFNCDDYGNIDSDNLEVLFEFTDLFKNMKLKKIQDLEARNLVSRLLSKDPSKRPSMTQVLQHPFHSNKKAVRMIGEEAEYDVFISYRVASDVDLAKELYDSLTKEGLKVWWDKQSLQPGESWENGFCNGLIKSRIYVPILSRYGINNPGNDYCNFSKLNENSYCDNLFLEFALSLELYERGLVEKIYPVFIGDRYYNNKTKNYIYSDYFIDGCHPSIGSDLVVKSIEWNMNFHLDRLSLGSMMLSNLSTLHVVNEIKKFQGHKFVGNMNENMRTISSQLKSIFDKQTSSIS